MGYSPRPGWEHLCVGMGQTITKARSIAERSIIHVAQRAEAEIGERVTHKTCLLLTAVVPEESSPLRAGASYNRGLRDNFSRFRHLEFTIHGEAEAEKRGQPTSPCSNPVILRLERLFSFHTTPFEVEGTTSLRVCANGIIQFPLPWPSTQQSSKYISQAASVRPTEVGSELCDTFQPAVGM